ncbi:hypothetical protein CPB86DRAFT_742502, partial [Serendipita vermifera]
MLRGEPPSISVAVGITIGLVASFIQSAGLTLQRKSHLQNEELPESERKVEHRRPLWLVGFTIFITSNVLGSVFQIASLPVVILAPLGAVSLLWNALFAWLLLGDVFSHYMLIGTVLIAGGAVLIAIFGIVPEPTHSLEDLLRLFARRAFIVYFSLLGTALLVVLVITHIAESRLPAEATNDSPMLAPLSDNDHQLEETTMTQPSERTPLLMDNKSSTSIAGDAAIANKKMWIAISYASASGILSGMCLLFAKSGVELLLLTFTGSNQFWRWESWALVGGLVVFALLQLWYLHKSLILANPTLVCPLAFCFYNLSSIFNGLVYYDQFALLSALKLGLVMLGMTILLAGVWAVSMQPGGNGRVEVGTWQEGAEVLTAEVTGMERRTGVMTDEPGIMSTSPGSADERDESISPLPQGSMLTPFPSLRSPRSPLSPSGSRRYGELGHGHGPPGPRRKWTQIFESQPGVTAGLSIGISATSPGFALVPRRRVSS